MLLRSSSIPALGRLLSSFSGSPNNHHQTKLLYNPTASLNFLTHSRTSSTISPSITQFSEACIHSKHGFLRAQSEGNLEGLASVSSNCNEFNISDAPRKLTPSLSFRCLESRYENACNLDKEEENRESEEYESFANSVRGEETGMAKTSGELNLMEDRRIVLNQKINYLNKYKNIRSVEGTEDVSADIGVNSCGCSGGGGDSITAAIGGDGRGMEEHYKSLVENNPDGRLSLRNFAQFLRRVLCLAPCCHFHPFLFPQLMNWFCHLLWQRKQYGRAKEHSSGAILADPEDGETLSLYTKLLWKLHHDQQRATNYFEMAILAAPENSLVQAACASFLWEADEAEEADSSHSYEDMDSSHF